MSTTLTTLQQETRRRLNEAANSSASALESGTSSTPTITSDNGLTEYINQAQELISRLCVPVYDTATLSYTSGTAQARLATFTPTTTGQIPWAVLEAKFGSSALTWLSLGIYNLYYSTSITDSNGTPLYYFTTDDSIGIRPVPSSTGTVTIRCYSYPARLSSGSDAVSFLADAETPLIVRGACWLVCVKNLDDASLGAREAVFRRDFGADMDKHWERLDEGTRAFFRVRPSEYLMGMAASAGAKGR